MRQIEVRIGYGEPYEAIEGSTLTLDEGSLVVLDSNGSDVAIYAPGAWLSARFVPERPVIVNTPEPGEPVRPT